MKNKKNLLIDLTQCEISKIFPPLDPLVKLFPPQNLDLIEHKLFMTNKGIYTDSDDLVLFI